MHRSRFRVEVERRGSGSLNYRWAIYYGSTDISPLKASTGRFASQAEALAIGKVALADFLRRLAANSELDDY
jgi:hypothetical protein